MTRRLLAALVLAGSLVRPTAAQDVGLLIGLSHESAYDSMPVQLPTHWITVTGGARQLTISQ